MGEPIHFIADKVKLNGPKVDGGYSVTFEVGGYVWDQIKELPRVNGETIVVAVVTEAIAKKTENKDNNVVEDIPQIEG